MRLVVTPDVVLDNGGTVIERTVGLPGGVIYTDRMSGADVWSYPNIHGDVAATWVRFTERLDEIGARPSIGTVADSYDNALAETVNGLYKTECVYGPDAPRPWNDVDELELATLSWVQWFNNDRLHSHCGDIPPAEFEAAHYAAQQPTPIGVGNR